MLETKVAHFASAFGMNWVCGRSNLISRREGNICPLFRVDNNRGNAPVGAYLLSRYVSFQAYSHWLGSHLEYKKEKAWFLMFLQTRRGSIYQPTGFQSDLCIKHRQLVKHVCLKLAIVEYHNNRWMETYTVKRWPVFPRVSPKAPSTPGSPIGPVSPLGPSGPA